MKNLKIIFVSFIVLMTNCFAQAPNESEGKPDGGRRPEEKDNVSIGTGLAIKKNNRVGNTYEDADKATIAKAFPLVQAKFGDFTLGAQGLAWQAWGNPFMGVSLTANLGGERYESPGMQGRKKSLFLGTLLKFEKYSLLVSRDVSCKSRGIESQLSFNEVYPMGEGLLLRASVFLEWVDNKYARYYYGVRSSEATPNRPAYEPGNFFTPGAGLMSIYRLQQNLTLLTGISLRYQTDRMTDSPTVKNEPLNTSGFLGISFKFD